jgi:small-conductance mechanosensitive channel
VNDKAANPLWQRAGAIVGTALLASAFASLPAALRIASEEVSFLRAWLVLTGTALLPAIVLLGIFRAAREGLRALRGQHPAARAMGALVWLGAVVLFLARFGSMLRAKTHHHALAGVTFAIGAVIAMLVLAIFVARLVRWAEVDRSRNVMLVGVLLLVGTLLVRSVPDGLSPETRAGAVDGAAALVALVLGATELTRRKRALTIAGPALAALCLVVAIASPSLGPSLAGAPIHALLVRMR